jgi:putative transcriptional regulator
LSLVVHTRQLVAEKIAGEVTLSDKPGQTIKKWRDIFGVSQTELAAQLAVSPSVISDYESGRRKSPGTQTIRRLVEALITLDETRGGAVVRKYSSMLETPDAILDIRELYTALPADRLVKAVEGEVVAVPEGLDRSLKGYTVVDSVKAITKLSAFEYLKIYGWSSERALVFTGISYGRSPMVAIRVHPMKPAMVVYHRPQRVDELALRLAKMEGIPLVVTHMPLDRMVQALQGL